MSDVIHTNENQQISPMRIFHRPTATLTHQNIPSNVILRNLRYRSLTNFYDWLRVSTGDYFDFYLTCFRYMTFRQINKMCMQGYPCV